MGLVSVSPASFRHHPHQVAPKTITRGRRSPAGMSEGDLRKSMAEAGAAQRRKIANCRMQIANCKLGGRRMCELLETRTLKSSMSQRVGEQIHVHLAGVLD